MASPLEALRDAISKCSSCGGDGVLVSNGVRMACTQCLPWRQVLSGESGEPVAWRWRKKGSVLWIYDPVLDWLTQQGDDIERQPLYAHPAIPDRDKVIEECAEAVRSACQQCDGSGIVKAVDGDYECNHCTWQTEVIRSLESDQKKE